MGIYFPYFKVNPNAILEPHATDVPAGHAEARIGLGEGVGNPHVEDDGLAGLGFNLGLLDRSPVRR